MRRLLLVFVCLFPACAYDAATGEYFAIHSDPDAIKFGGADDKTPIGQRLGENLRVQRYMREHNGKHPTDEEFLPP
jgi:hypothetical protein